MTLFLSFVVSLFLTVALMPVLIRYAAPLRLLDKPSPRKVHATPIPRCGGVALATGTIGATLIWVEIDTQLLAFFSGLAVITLVGVWDDRVTLNYVPKLIAQFVAAGILIAGDIQFTHLPLFGLDPVPGWLGAAATMIFVVAVTNAVNLSDGLDGLAAGSVLISLAIIALLALPGENLEQFITLAALTGGIFGFLRFNTYPAQVFLGDGGSYFLGFSIATLIIMLMIDTNLAVSPAVGLLIPGLPLLDMAWVTISRVLSGKSPFTADTAHFHHKLLHLGLSHHNAVVIYYLLHALLCAGAILLAYEADLLILGLYAAAFAGIVSCYQLSDGRQVTMKGTWAGILGSFGSAKRETLRHSQYIDLLLSFGFAGFVGLSFLSIDEIPFGIASLPPAMAVLIAASLMRKHLDIDTVVRFCIHIATIVIIYLSSGNDALPWYPVSAQYMHLAGLLVLLAFSMRADIQNRFRLTSFDSLLIIVALVSPLVVQRYLGDFPASEFVVKTAILLYVAEYLYRGESAIPRTMSRAIAGLSLCLCLAAISVKGVMG